MGSCCGLAGAWMDGMGSLDCEGAMKSVKKRRKTDQVCPDTPEDQILTAGTPGTENSDAGLVRAQGS